MLHDHDDCLLQCRRKGARVPLHQCCHQLTSCAGLTSTAFVTEGSSAAAAAKARKEAEREGETAECRGRVQVLATMHSTTVQYNCILNMHAYMPLTNKRN